MSDRPNVRLFASSDAEEHPEATLGMFRCRARGAVSVPFGSVPHGSVSDATPFRHSAPVDGRDGRSRTI